jgi:glycerol-3-phosphate acyltransferase PlsY
VITALGGVIGHNWPIFYRFKGGRGISAIYGGLFAIDPLCALSTSVAGMLIALLILRDFALIFPISLFLVIPWMVLRTNELIYILYAVAINVLFFLAIIPELKEVVRSRKEKGGAGTMQEKMETNPMGRSMLKIARRFGWLK